MTWLFELIVAPGQLYELRVSATLVNGVVRLDYVAPAGTTEVSLLAGVSIEGLRDEPLVLQRVTPPADGRGAILVDPTLYGPRGFFRLLIPSE